MTEPLYFEAGALQAWTTRLFHRAGLAEGDAAIVAENLVGANLRGVDSHGVGRLAGIYVKRIELGLIARETRITVLRDAPAFALVDGNSGPGAVVSVQAMRLAMEKAQQVGIAVVGVCNSNHNGYLAQYAQMAAEQSMISMIFTSAPANMAPWGGKKPYFGANPICVGVPAGRERPIVVDMATSVVAKGKIIMAAKLGKKEIPEGWALDSDGRPTTDPETAIKGTLLPVGGPKGYGLAMLVDIFSGIMTGAMFGPHIGDLYKVLDRGQELGHFFLAMRSDLFVSAEQFGESIDQMISEVRSQPRAEGVERIYMPGEIEHETAVARGRDGIPLPAEIVAELTELGQRLAVPFVAHRG